MAEKREEIRQTSTVSLDDLRFYVGLHQPGDAHHFPRCMISAKRLREVGRKSCPPVGEWMLDSGAFMEIKQYGSYRQSPEEYGAEVRRWWQCGYLAAAVTQDYMCEPFILNITGLTVPEHQRLTIERFDRIKAFVGWMVYVMPVIQGYQPEEYAAHVRQYGDRLRPNGWVGVGSVCKRNVNPNEIARVLQAVKAERPDLRLHGFGIKLTALASAAVRRLLYSADSMAWSYRARKQGRNGNSPTEAAGFVRQIENQGALPLWS